MKGLKTGMYYLRTRPAANAIQFTVDKSRLRQLSRKPTDEVDDSVSKQTEAMLMCSLQNKENCLMCSSWNSVIYCSVFLISLVCICCVAFNCDMFLKISSVCFFLTRYCGFSQSLMKHCLVWCRFLGWFVYIWTCWIHFIYGFSFIISCVLVLFSFNALSLLVWWRKCIYMPVKNWALICWRW